MDVLPDLSQFEKVGVVGLCVFIVIGFAFEVIVSGRSHRREVKALEDTVKWQRQVIDDLTVATQNLTVSADTSATALREISKTANAARAQVGDE